MSTIHIPWKDDIDWNECVHRVRHYYESGPKLKYGPAQQNKAFPVIHDLCSFGCVSRAYLNKAHALETNDAMLTILSNVTMAIQISGEVRTPEEGGWYATIDNPYSYIVAPGFAAAWK